MDPITDREVQQHLVTARALIAERGHCKDVLVEGDGRMCLRGALLASIAPEPTTDALMEVWRQRKTFGPMTRDLRVLIACEEALGFTVVRTFTDAPTWNNSRRTTKGRVLRRFDQTIKNFTVAPSDRESELRALDDLGGPAGESADSFPVEWTRPSIPQPPVGVR